LVEKLQVRGLPVSIRRGPASLLLDAQCLTLGGRGYLGLNRGHLGPSWGCLGLCRGYLGLDRGYLGLDRGYLGLCRGRLRLGRVVDLDGGLMQIPGEDVRGNRCSPRGYFSQLVHSLVVASSDVVELVGDRYSPGHSFVRSKRPHERTKGPINRKVILSWAWGETTNKAERRETRLVQTRTTHNVERVNRNRDPTFPRRSPHATESCEDKSARVT
jgi:hypothetical protein